MIFSFHEAVGVVECGSVERLRGQGCRQALREKNLTPTLTRHMAIDPKLLEDLEERRRKIKYAAPQEKYDALKAYQNMPAELKPFVPEKLVNKALKALFKTWKKQCMPGAWNAIIVPIINHLPDWLVFAVMKRFPLFELKQK